MKYRSQAAVILLVLAGHCGLLWVLLIATMAERRTLRPGAAPLIVWQLPPPLAAVEPQDASQSPRSPPLRDSRGPRSASTPRPEIVSTPRQTTDDLQMSPPIDWSREINRAVREAASQAERNEQYRNLAGLTRAQLEWVRRNHLQPAPPTFAWDHRRRDNGNPLGVFWIGEHCAIVGIIPFCRFGHIEPNGSLFDHMRDPHDP